MNRLFSLVKLPIPAKLAVFYLFSRRGSSGKRKSSPKRLRLGLSFLLLCVPTWRRTIKICTEKEPTSCERKLHESSFSCGPRYGRLAAAGRERWRWRQG